VGRKEDIYVCMVSFSHAVAAQGKYVVIASTTVETSDPIAELAPALDLIGPVLERFDMVSETFEPVGSGAADACYISASYDATSHFETTSQVPFLPRCVSLFLGILPQVVKPVGEKYATVF
jgi:Rab GDP dissociation inhibitor